MARPVRFAPREGGVYELTLAPPDPGRYRVSVRAHAAPGMPRATAGDAAVELGHAGTEFAVDRWSLEEAQSDPDTATLAALARETGGALILPNDLERDAGRVAQQARRFGRVETARLWESPWVFAFVVGALGMEWIWRRRRGLP